MRSLTVPQSSRGFTNLLLLLILGALLAGNASAQPGAAGPQALAGTGFTYQGQLKKANGLVNAVCDFQFSLWDDVSAGVQLGSTQSIAGVNVSAGLFTVQLNGAGQFGPAAFNSQGRWVQVGVKCAGDAVFATLSPRQPLTPTPYALALPGLRTEQSATSPSIIGGADGNTVTSGAVGAVVSGGGASSFFQTAATTAGAAAVAASTGVPFATAGAAGMAALLSTLSSAGGHGSAGAIIIAGSGLPPRSARGRPGDDITGDKSVRELIARTKGHYY